MTVLEAWNRRKGLVKEGDKLCDEAQALCEEADKVIRKNSGIKTALTSKMDSIAKMREAEGAMAYAEADLIFCEAVLENHGNTEIKWNGFDSVTVENVKYLMDAGPEEVEIGGTKYKLIKVD